MREKLRGSATEGWIEHPVARPVIAGFKMSKNPYGKRRPETGLEALRQVIGAVVTNRKVMNIYSGPNPVNRTE